MNYIIGGLILFIILYFGRYKLEHIILLNKILENSHDGYWIYYDNRDVSWWSKQWKVYLDSNKWNKVCNADY